MLSVQKSWFTTKFESASVSHFLPKENLLFINTKNCKNWFICCQHVRIMHTRADKNKSIPTQQGKRPFPGVSTSKTKKKTSFFFPQFYERTTIYVINKAVFPQCANRLRIHKRIYVLHSNIKSSEIYFA